MQDIANKLLQQQRPVELYQLARFMYRMGYPIIDDATYDTIHNSIKEHNVLPDYVTRSYDDDPVPLSLLQEFGLTEFLPNYSEHGSKYDAFLDSEKTMSIASVENYRDVYEYCLATPNEDKTLSVKINGANIKSYLTKEEDEDYSTLKVSRTKGRTGESFNVTRNMLRIFNHSKEIKKDGFRVVGECYVRTDAIDKGLFNKNGFRYSVSRSAAISMLRTDFNDDDYQYLKYCLFEVDGDSNSNYENLMYMKNLGFDIAPIKLIKADEIPLEDFSEFCEWLKGQMDYFYNICVENHMPADGLVMDIDNRAFMDSVSGHYSNRNIALKFEYWSHSYYRGIVKDLIIEQKSKKCSVRASIEPLVTEDKSVARVVNLHSLSIAVKNGIKPGAYIYFKRHSGVYNNLVYGEELRQLLGVDSTCLVNSTDMFQNS